MRRMGAGMAVAVLLAALAASAALAQDEDGDLHSAAPQSKSWWDGWFTPAAKTDKPDAKKSKADKPDAKKADAVPTPPLGPTPVELAAAARQRERADLNRRWEVCDCLMKIAVLNNDAAMTAQINQLHDRAWELYEQRAASQAAASAPDDAPGDRVRPTNHISAGHFGGKPTTDDDASVVREVKP